MNDPLTEMVEFDLRRRGIQDERVLAAFAKVDRRHFVSALDRPRAYDDCALPITHGQTISQPFMVALMLEALHLTGTEKALEIGTGSGYQTALLAELCREVWTVERIEFLATTAEDLLLELGYRNVHYHLGDGSLGWLSGAPYDRIVVSAACPALPSALVEQLTEGGIVAAPVGPPAGQDLVVGTKRAGQLETHVGTSCIFVRLIGAQGFANAAQAGEDAAP